MKAFIVKYIRQLVSIFEAVLISKREYYQYQSQLTNAVHDLVEEEAKHHDVGGIACIIFSKDRVIQLHSLLETYEKFVSNPAPIYVIYEASSNEHELSYLELSRILNKKSLDIKFIKEKKSFRKTLLELLSSIKTKKTFFLTDDNIFISNVDLSLLSRINPLKKILSLRHNPNINYSYTANENFNPPNFKPCKENNQLLEFNWFERECEWSDPWSVDGHIYSTAEVLVLSKISDYRFPNSYEASLKSFNFLMNDRKGVCFSKSVILNIPLNIVQNESDNLSGNVSTDYLLKCWNDGFKLDVSFLEDHPVKSTHEIQSLSFVRR